MNRQGCKALLRVALLGVVLALVANTVWAADDLDEWGGWNALPDEFLELTDSRNAAELSARLDQLIRESGGTTQSDVILEAWLRQLTQQEGAASLDSLLDAWTEGEPAAIERGRGRDPDTRPGSAAESASDQQPGSARGSSQGRGSERSEGRPAQATGRENSSRGRGNTPRSDASAPGEDSSR